MKKLSYALIFLLLSAVLTGTFFTPSNVYAEEPVLPEYTTADYGDLFAADLISIDALKQPCSEKGTIVSLTYTAPAYAVNEMLGKNETIDKTLQVYLPFGYDETNQYNILYLLHGTGGKDTYWFFDAEPETTRNVLDNMIQMGLCDPLIVVTPNYISEIRGKEYKIKDDVVAAYAEETQDSYLKVRNDLWTQYFQYELRNDIMPLVESQFSTFSGKDTSEESMRASRDHRAMAGLSRGSMATMRSGMVANLDEISWFGNYSGIWLDFITLEDALRNSEYTVNYWYNGTGDGDFAAENHLAFHNAVMENLSDLFTDGENYAMVVKNGGAHDYASWITDLYNSLLVFFK